jgi:hypothetical protein
MLINRVVVNASPLICLFKSGLEDLFPSLFNDIVVPEAVTKEVTAKGEADFATFFKNQIAPVSYRIMNFPKSAEPIEIEKSLFGWRLKIGQRIVDCSSEAQALYLRVFAEMGCDQTLVPKDDAYLSSIVNQWESLFEKAQAALQEYISSILQNKTRDLLIHTVWATLREQMS